MADLTDYSGPLDTALKYDDSSKEALFKAPKTYGEHIRVLDGIWYLTVKNMMSDDIAFDCDLRAWNKMETYDVDITRKMFNIRIRGDDVAALVEKPPDEPLDVESGSPRLPEGVKSRYLDRESLPCLASPGERRGG